MSEDLVQYSCKRNMTMDGCWNARNETPGAGPVQIDGTAPAGQQDGTLNGVSTNSSLSAGVSNVDVTPRPIWDGIPVG